MRAHGLSWWVVVAAVGSASTAAAGGIGYAEATGYFKQDTRPTLYQPLNLLDARDATAWCSPSSDPLNDHLGFGFDEPVTIDELVVTTGNNFDATTFQDFARARKIKLSAGKQKVELMLADQRGPQTLTLKKPITAARFTLEVLDVFPADDPDMPACLTDVVFMSGGKALNGPWLTRKLKYDRNQSKLIGVWYSGYPKTPHHFLAFNFDGTFRYSFEPFDTSREKPEVLEGSYDASGSRIVFVVKGKKHRATFTRAPAAQGGGFTLAFEGDVPAPLKAEFRSVP